MSKVIGTPTQDATFFPGQQSYPDTCAIRCQEMILEEFTGVDIPEASLVTTAEQHGWYVPGGGTSPQDVGNLLELNGIPVTRYEEATIMNLAAELVQGHKVIIGVDSQELWQQETDVAREIQQLLGMQTADHAVVVSGIDTRDPENVKVLISDPGTGEAVAAYPVEQFMEAWQGSDFFMVATQQPAPINVMGMENFPYDVGHLAQFGEWSYEELEDFAVAHDMDAAADTRSVTDTEQTSFSDPIEAVFQEIDDLLQSISGEEVYPASAPSSLAGANTEQSPTAASSAIDMALREIENTLDGVAGGLAELAPLTPGLSNPYLTNLQESILVQDADGEISVSYDEAAAEVDAILSDVMGADLNSPPPADEDANTDLLSLETTGILED